MKIVEVELSIEDNEEDMLLNGLTKQNIIKYEEYKDTVIFEHFEKVDEDDTQYIKHYYAVESLFDKGYLQYDADYRIFYPSLIGEQIINKLKEQK